MTAKTPPKAPKEKVVLVERDGQVVAQWQLFTLRLLFSDGTTVDIVTHQDDSDLRRAALKYFGKEQIAGVVDLPLAPPPTAQRRSRT